MSAPDGYKLPIRFDEVAKNVGAAGNGQKDGTINIHMYDTIKLPQLTERQQLIYNIIKNGTVNDTVNGTVNDTVNAQNISALLGKSVITIKRDLYVLRDMNLIQFVGSDKTGHWEVIKE